jgi:secreted PhoX family phosphatase
MTFLFAVLSLVVLLGAAVPSAFAQDDQPLVPLTDPAAPFLESRAVAAKLGATAEFRKMEWVAYDDLNKKLYIAMTEISKGMSDGEGAIQLPENLCGIVYVSDVDETGNISNMKPLIVGGPFDKAAAGDKCDVNNIANPDSVFVDGKGRLWIGEDTSYHVNNALWMWDGQKLNRFATVPKGGEVTGFFAAKDGTIFFNSQHPSGANLHPYNRGVVGVVNGFKASDAFTPMPAPEGANQNKIMTAAGQYQVLARVGEAIPDDIYGQRYGQINDLGGALQQICNAPDGNMWLPTAENGSEGYLYTNYECQPGAMSRIYIRNNGKSWDVLEGENVDSSSVNGMWNNCGATVTPWNTGLSAEEYEPIATQADWKANVAPMTAYLGKQANPYDYGWLIEVMPDPSGDSAGSVVEKRYAMGRFSHEMNVVLPDGKTTYHGDDGTNVVLFKFVADEAGDLSAGTLYAAKITQKDDQSLDLEWIKLGSGNDDEIAEAIAGVTLPK